MKTSLFMLFVSLILFQTTYSQCQLEGKVIDSETELPIAFVNIGIVEHNLGTVSNYEGNFKLSCEASIDNIIFSSIGYESKSLTVDEVKKLQTVTLIPKSYSLAAIDIKAKRFDELDKKFGVKNEKRGHSIGFGNSQLGTEIGAPIKIEGTAYIKSAHFTINHAKGDSMVFRMNLYEFENGTIGKSLLNQNIIIRSRQNKGLTTIDLEDKNIVLTSDVLLSLEWITDDNGRGNVGLTFDSKKSKKPNGIYLRYSSNAKFKRVPHKLKITPCFYLIGNSINPG